MALSLTTDSTPLGLISSIQVSLGDDQAQQAVGVLLVLKETPASLPELCRYPNRATAATLQQTGWSLLQHEQHAHGLLRLIVAE